MKKEGDCLLQLERSISKGEIKKNILDWLIIDAFLLASLYFL